MEVEAQVERIASAIPPLEAEGDRVLIAIAGPPGSGKSTVAARLQQTLQTRGTPCGLVPMDGFHLDNDILRDRGLLARKGAPETFDVAGFAALIDRFAEGGAVPIPVFDREADRVIEDGDQVAADERYVIVEGNYLFLARRLAQRRQRGHRYPHHRACVVTRTRSGRAGADFVPLP